MGLVNELPEQSIYPSQERAELRISTTVGDLDFQFNRFTAGKMLTEGEILFHKCHGVGREGDRIAFQTFPLIEKVNRQSSTCFLLVCFMTFFKSSFVALWAKVLVSVGLFRLERLDGKEIAATNTLWEAHAKAEVASKVRCNKCHRDRERRRDMYIFNFDFKPMTFSGRGIVCLSGSTN